MQADRASVLWTTQAAGSGSVTALAHSGKSFTAPAVMQSFQPSDTQMTSPFYQYQADILGLQPGTEYSYSISVDGQELVSGAGQYRFRTAPPSNSFSFLALGDSGADSPEQQTLVQLMADEPDISMVLHVGDMAYPEGTFQELEDAYFGVNFPLMRRLPFFSTPGNHEYLTSSAAPYLASTVAPESGVPAVDQGRYYSFDWGNTHFVSVDSNLLATPRASAMLAWLDADLAATKQYWRIVFLHHTPYPTGYHLGDPICADVQQLVNPIIERHGVQLLLAGHEHGYERTYPLIGGQPVSSSPSTTYIVTGGGGGMLESVGSFPQTAISVQAYHYLRVDVEGTALTLSAIGLDGNTIDQVTLGASTQISVESVLSKGDYTSPVAPGSVVAISGRNLAHANAVSSGYPLPTGLNGVSLKVAGQSMPLLSVSSTRIEAQMPYGVSGPVTLEVSTPNGFASTALTVSAVAPSLLEIVSQNGLFSGSNPARPGGVISLYLTGLGEVQGGIETGHAAASGSIAVVSPVDVWLGHRRLEPRFAGLAQGHAGIYRVDIAIPKDLPDGIYPIRVVSGGISSRSANLDVVARGRGDYNSRALAKIQS